MRKVSRVRRFTVVIGLAAAILAGGLAAAPSAFAEEASGGRGFFGSIWDWSGFDLFGAAPAASKGGCSDVEVVFARGTGEFPGLGILGTPLARGLQRELSGRSVSSYGVDYAASFSQASAGPGATDMSRHITEVATRCPKTKFVIGGYSQGASVVTIAIGVRGASLTRGEPIPAKFAKRIAAVVVFGNPLGMSRRTIEKSSATYGPKTRSFCNAADTVCGGNPGGPSGSHLSYMFNGAVNEAVKFAAAKVGRAG